MTYQEQIDELLSDLASADEVIRELTAMANLVDVAWAGVWPFVSYLPESQSGNAIDRMQKAMARLMTTVREVPA